ncbi:hypothetical protein HanIR_Chr06g0288081 [Helianthus annuus]|nr:hypothetical protein HanIR_Chr06g0288081 [Helianthus annuus]
MNPWERLRKSYVEFVAPVCEYTAWLIFSHTSKGNHWIVHFQPEMSFCCSFQAELPQKIMDGTSFDGAIELSICNHYKISID